MTEAPELKDKLDAATAVVANGPEDAPLTGTPSTGVGLRVTYGGCGSGLHGVEGGDLARSASCRS